MSVIRATNIQDKTQRATKGGEDVGKRERLRKKEPQLTTIRSALESMAYIAGQSSVSQQYSRRLGRMEGEPFAGEVSQDTPQIGYSGGQVRRN